VDAVEGQGLADGGDLLDEAVHAPEGRVVRDVRAAAAKLVVEDDGALVGKRLHRFEVIVAGAGSAVQDEQRNAGRVRAGDAVPDAAAGNGDLPLFRYGLWSSANRLRAVIGPHVTHFSVSRLMYWSQTLLLGSSLEGSAGFPVML